MDFVRPELAARESHLRATEAQAGPSSISTARKFSQSSAHVARNTTGADGWGRAPGDAETMDETGRCGEGEAGPEDGEDEELLHGQSASRPPALMCRRRPQPSPLIKAHFGDGGEGI